MIDYIFGEEYDLPSRGRVYNHEVNPHIKLRSMTTNEEMKRLRPSDRPYKVMADIIDDCLVEKPGISAYDMCLGDFQFLLYKLRIVTYGEEYKVVCKCPFCLSNSTETIDLDSLPVLEYTDELENQLEFELPKTKHSIRLKMQTPRMMDDIELKSKEFAKKAKQFDGDSAFLFSLKEQIELVDGEAPDPIFVEQWIRELPAADANYIKRKAQKLANAIGVENKLEVVCDVCGMSYDSSFRVAEDFFDPGLDD